MVAELTFHWTTRKVVCAVWILSSEFRQKWTSALTKSTSLRTLLSYLNWASWKEGNTYKVFKDEIELESIWYISSGKQVAMPFAFPPMFVIPSEEV